jgi:hypothetical protein
VNQIELIKGIFISPKKTLQALPSDSIFLLGWLAPFYFGMAKIFRPDTYEKALSYINNEYLLFIVASVFALIMIPLGAIVIKLIIRVFGKKLTIKKLMNIYGYALLPRVVVALIAYVIIFIEPNVFQNNDLNILSITIIGAGVIGLTYTVFLYVYGIVISPSTVKNT